MINNYMKYYFIYKTTHRNGKYYIGRHTTDNLDDGYIGSGKWPESIKDTSLLTREILEYCDNEQTLVKLEGEYLSEHFGKPNCMNMTPDPIGFNTDNNPMKDPSVVVKISGDNHWLSKNPERKQEISDRQKQKYVNDIHNWSENHPNKDRSISRKTAANGRNIFQTNNPSIWRSEQGIHHWQNGNSPNAGGKLNKKLIAEGRHNLVGPEHNRLMIAEGKNPWVGSEGNNKRLAEGTHPSQQKRVCEHCGKTVSIGMYARWHGSQCSKVVDK